MGHPGDSHRTGHLHGYGFLGQRSCRGNGRHNLPLVHGREIARTETHEGYRTEIHRPVFDGLLGERDKGFVQIKWMPESGKLSPLIEEEIDFNKDNSTDFFISLDTRTNEATLRPESSSVIALRDIINFGEGRVARVWLKNGDR